MAAHHTEMIYMRGIQKVRRLTQLSYDINNSSTTESELSHLLDQVHFSFRSLCWKV